jgi:hypothetical protein
LHVPKTHVHPEANAGTGLHKHLVHADQPSSDVGRGALGDVDWGQERGGTDGQAVDRPASQEHGYVAGPRLKRGTDDEDDAGEQEGESTSKTIGDGDREQSTSGGTDLEV